MADALLRSCSVPEDLDALLTPSKNPLARVGKRRCIIFKGGERCRRWEVPSFRAAWCGARRTRRSSGAVDEFRWYPSGVSETEDRTVHGKTQIALLFGNEFETNGRSLFICPLGFA